MVSKEDFKKVWEDSSRESILNQFYYEHYELFRIKKEIREYIEKHIAIFKNGNMLVDMNIDELLRILDKENK